MYYSPNQVYVQQQPMMVQQQPMIVQQPQPMIVQQQPVYVQPQPVYSPPVYSQPQNYTPNYYQVAPSPFPDQQKPSYASKLSAYHHPSPRDWRALFCGCSDVGVICTACFCPCVQYANNRMLAGDTEDCCGDCMSYCLSMTFFSCCCVASFMGAGHRKQIRRGFHIQGDDCTDFLAHYCCYTFALAQEHEEMVLTMGIQP